MAKRKVILNLLELSATHCRLKDQNIMHRHTWLTYWFVHLLCISTSACFAQYFQCTALKVEQLINPIGLDTQQPVLGWQLKSNRRGVKQVAYQVMVATSKDHILITYFVAI